MDAFTLIAQATQTALGISISAIDLPVYEDVVQVAMKPTPVSDSTFRLDKGRIQTVGIQLLVRDKNWLVAWNKINEIHELWQVNNTLIQGKIQATTNPNHIGITERGLHEFTAIYVAEIERS